MSDVELREALAAAKQTIQEQDEFLKKITSAPLGVGTVLALNKEHALVVADGKYLQLEAPASKLSVGVGDTVALVTETMQIAKVLSSPVGGQIAVIKRVIDSQLCEVGLESGTAVVFTGRLDASKLDKGDRVLVDRSGCVLLANYGKDEDSFVAEATGVTWGDIGGLESAKRQMIEAVEFPHKHPELYKHYNKKPTKGVLLYGAPGCGKTMLGKAAATALQSIYKGKKGAATGFFYVKGPEILDPFVGVAEATVRRLFARAREHKKTCGFPAVVFIDEAEAILGRRGSGLSSDVERTIVPMFLTEMDGLEESAALVILATNRPDRLDEAVIRDGRIDRKIEITRPDKASTATIFKLNLAPLPLANGDDKGKLATECAEQVFAPERRIGDGLPLSSIVSGAMVANIVDQATSIALRRDLEAKKKTGIARDDLLTAIEVVESQSREAHNAKDYLSRRTA